MWTSVLAVIAHPDGASIGLGPILDAFVIAGAKVEMLCLTHGQAWTLEEAPGDLAALRGAELASADDVLGPVRAKMQGGPDGCLSEVCQKKLADEVVAAADSCHPDGLLVFDTSAASGHLDHVAATIRGRNSIRRQVQALSAEGKLSAVILLILPIGLTVVISIVNPSYLRELTDSTAGNVMIVGGILLLGIGGLWLRRIVRIVF